MFLETRTGRISYVAGLTLILTGLGFWAAVEIGLPTSTLADAALTDAPFAKSAGLAELHTLKFSLLAQDKAKSDAVRNLASQILADQTLTSAELKRTAFKENISLPTDLAARDQAAYDHLSALDDLEFDKTYVRTMVRELSDDLQAFRREAASGNDNLVRRFAAKAIPAIENHMDQARTVLKTFAAPSRRTASAGSSHQTPARK